MKTKIVICFASLLITIFLVGSTTGMAIQNKCGSLIPKIGHIDSKGIEDIDFWFPGPLINKIWGQYIGPTLIRYTVSDRSSINYGISTETGSHTVAGVFPFINANIDNDWIAGFGIFWIS